MKTDDKLPDIRLSDFIFASNSKDKRNKIKINKLDCTKPKSFCTLMEIINKRKRQPIEWKNTFEVNCQKICVGDYFGGGTWQSP